METRDLNSRRDNLYGIEASPRRPTGLTREEKKLVAIRPELKAAYKSFLRQPDTGLARLQVKERCPKKASPRGQVAYYSFAKKKHGYDEGADITFQNGELIDASGGAGFGFLAHLGDVLLEDISRDANSVKFLADFVPPKLESEARSWQRQTHEGFEVNGKVYRRKFSVFPNTTYVLRSIQYQYGDVLAAFRVIEVGGDGSITILWKLLNKYPVPKLETKK